MIAEVNGWAGTNAKEAGGVKQWIRASRDSARIWAPGWVEIVTSGGVIRDVRTGTDDVPRDADAIDLGAVPGNPLDDVTATELVSFVMLGGEVFKHEQ